MNTSHCDACMQLIEMFDNYEGPNWFVHPWMT